MATALHRFARTSVLLSFRLALRVIGRHTARLPRSINPVRIATRHSDTYIIIVLLLKYRRRERFHRLVRNKLLNFTCDRNEFSYAKSSRPWCGQKPTTTGIDRPTGTAAVVTVAAGVWPRRPIISTAMLNYNKGSVTDCVPHEIICGWRR